MEGVLKVKTIFKNLDLISISSQKYIDLSELSYSLRNNLYLLKDGHTFEGLGQELNILLSDEELIDLINNVDFSSSNIKFLLNSYSKNYNNNPRFIKLLKETLKIKNFSNHLDTIYNILKSTIPFDNRATLICNIIKYLNDQDISNDKMFKHKILLYIEINSDLTKKKFPILSTLSNDYKLKFSFSSFILEKLSINMKLEDVCDIIKNISIEEFDDLDFLVDFCNNSKLISLLSSLYFQLSENKKMFISKLKSMNENKKNTLFIYLLNLSCKCDTLSLLEFDTIFSIIEENLFINDIFNFIYEKHSILLNPNMKNYQIDFIKRNLNKKTFIHLIQDNMEIFLNLPKDNILFKHKFSKLLNLNTLNKNNLTMLSNSSKNNNKNFLSKEKIKNILILDLSKELTFNEFWFLIRQDFFVIKLFYLFYDLHVKIDLRLKLLKELPNLELKFKEWNIKNNEIDDILNTLANLLVESSLKNRINSLKSQYKNLLKIKDDDFLFIILNSKIMLKFLQQINTVSDIYYILKNYKEINQRNISLYDFKIEKIKTDYYYEYLVEELDLSNSFVDNNISRIMKFWEKDLHKVFYSFMNNKNQESLQKNNMRKLVKAELMGKLKELKFVDKDFDLEIGLEVSPQIKEEWKNNLKIYYKNYTLKETYDFNNIIRLGENPVSTCQHWDGGIYSKCLLSNFDTNKKMIINTNDNIINTRALIRLTKGSFQKINNALTFKDIEKNEITKSNKEQIVLFLEKTYSNLDQSQLIEVQKEIIELAKQKSKILNVPLIVSNFYENVLPTETLIEYNLFISYSKNGCQYLDSLDGQAESINEGSYCSSYVYYIK